MKDGKNNAIRLKKLSIDDGNDVFHLLQQMPADENGFMNDAYGIAQDELPAWLEKKDAESRGENLQEGYVPQTIYWLMVDEVPVGYVKLRAHLTDSLRREGGHIGYGIAPAYRGKGYATMQLALVLQKAHAQGIESALLTANPDNTASRRVIEKCGGILADADAAYCRYFIDTGEGAPYHKYIP